VERKLIAGASATLGASARISAVASRWLLFLAVAAFTLSRCGVTVKAGAQETSPSFPCEFRQLRPAAPVDELIDYKVAPKGSLFVAGPRTVFVRSPRGWSEAFRLPDGDADTITAIGIILVGTDEVLLVAASGRLWQVRWHDQMTGWGFLTRTFETSEIVLGQPLDIAQVLAVGSHQGVIKGWLIDHNSGLSPVFADPSIRIGPKVTDEYAHSKHQWQVGPGGASFAWAYADSALLALSPQGVVTARYDLKDNIGDEPGGPLPAIQTLAVDPERDLIFVGSTRGVLEAKLDRSTGKVTSSFERLTALGTGRVRRLGFSLGRLVVIGEAAWPVGAGGGVLAWEAPEIVNWQDAHAMALSMAFNAGSRDLAAPRLVESSIQIDDDLIWAQDDDKKLWQWSPQGWRLVQSVATKDFRDPDLDAIPTPRQRPLVIRDGLGEHLAICFSPHPFRSDIHVTETADLAEMVPDPLGYGAWLLSRPTPSNPQEFGVPRLVSPNGFLDAAESTLFDFRVKISRFRHVTSEGQTYWPEGRDGGLVLPFGGQVIATRGGHWRLLNLGLEQDAAGLRSTTPGAKSSDTAWLAIMSLNSGRSKVVRVDVDKSRIEVVVESTALECASDSELVPDDDGYVWFACLRADGWHLSRIHAIVAEADREFAVGMFPDVPTAIVISETAGYLLGEKGMKSLGTAASRMALGSTKANGPLMDQILRDDSAKAARAQWEPWLQGRETSVVAVRPGLPAASSALGGRILLTRRTDVPGFEPGLPFQVDFDAETPLLQTLPVEDSRLSRRPLVEALEPEIATPGLRAWGPENDSSASGALEWFLDDSRRIELGDAPVSIARYNNSEFHSSSSRPSEWSAVATPEDVSFRRIPFSLSGSGIITAVSLKVDFSDRPSVTFDMNAGSPPAELPPTATRATLHIAPYYENWSWLSLSRAVALRAAPEGEWTPPTADGYWSEPLRAGAEHRIEAKVLDAQGLVPTTLAPLVFRVAPLPTLRAPWWAYALALLGGVVGSLPFISAVVRRQIFIVLGQRLTLVSDASDYDVVVRRNGTSAELSIRRRSESDYPEIVQAPSLGLSATEDGVFSRDWVAYSAIRAKFAAGTTITVEISDTELFRRPWASLLTSELGMQVEASVAGQVLGIERNMTAGQPPLKRLRFAAIGCPTPFNRRDAIWGLERHLERLDALLQHRLVETGEGEEDADVSALLRALLKADIVHVIAHASPAGIDLKDRTITARDLDKAFKKETPRCRLLVLAACQINDIRSEVAFVERLLNTGTSVLGATDKLDPIVAETFFNAFYINLVPRRSLAGASVAEGMRAGGRACAQLYGDNPIARDNMRALVFYGDPTLRIVLRPGTKINVAR
jgi:hypothetical protein